MNSVILTKIYEEPSYCEKEILRYSGCKEADEKVISLVNECINEVKGKLTYKVCYREFPVKIDNGFCDFEAFCAHSENLSKNLNGCSKTIVFAATVGVGIDRLIAKYSRLSPSKALMFQAIGAERIEALCDTFCSDIEKEYGVLLKPRFSPGYGDLSIDVQKNIFSLLDPERRIGLTLNDSLLMSPSKSVTAFAGIGNNVENVVNKCTECNKTDCEFRGVK